MVADLPQHLNSTGHGSQVLLSGVLAKNSSLRLAFLRSVEGLAFFLGDWLGDALLLVSREKEKPEPVEIEMLKTWP